MLEMGVGLDTSVGGGMAVAAGVGVEVSTTVGAGVNVGGEAGIGVAAVPQAMAAATNSATVRYRIALHLVRWRTFNSLPSTKPDFPR